MIHTYLRSQCRLKVASQNLQDSSCAPVMLISVLLSSERIEGPGEGEIGGWLWSRLFPEVAGVFENDCSPATHESLLSTEPGAGVFSSGMKLVVRYGACITGLTSSWKANGLKKKESETSRESPNLDNDEVQCGGREIKGRKGEDYDRLRRRLCKVGVRLRGAQPERLAAWKWRCIEQRSMVG